MAKKNNYPVKVGLVGLGVLSQSALIPHFMEADTKEKLDLVAVCDLNEERARSVAEKYQVPEFYTNIEEMLQKADIEATLICTPSMTLYENAIKTLNAGKHVYIQKTIATRAEKAQEIFELAKRKNLVAVASPEQMLNPARQMAKQMIEDGAIGPVFWALCITDHPGPQFEEDRLGDTVTDKIDPSWWFKKNAGPVFNMSVYSLHSITGILGPAKRVTAVSGQRLPSREWKGNRIDVEADDNTLMLLDFGDNVFSVVSGCTAYPGKSVSWGHLSIFGATGAIEIYSNYPTEPNFANVVENVGHEPIVISDFSPYIPENHMKIKFPFIFADIMHFLDCVVQDKLPEGYCDQATHVVEIIEKAYLSAQSRQSQSLETTFRL